MIPGSQNSTNPGGSNDLLFRVVDQVSKAGEAVNEDGISITGQTAWLLDGASGLSNRQLTSAQSDASWLVDRAVALLGRIGSSELDAQVSVLVEELNEAFEAEVRSNDIQQFEFPSASAIALRIEGDSLSYLQLGDCRAIISAFPGAHTFFTPAGPLAELDQRVVEKLQKVCQAESLSAGDAVKRVLADLRANRNLINNVSGYQALTVGQNRHFSSEINHLNVSAGGLCLIMSDGFMRLIDVFGKYSPQSLLSEASARGLDSLLLELRDLEGQYPGLDDYPRFKQFDDASAVLLTLDRKPH
jgi:uncharacterized protein YoaH (UPF0181 family)